MKNIHSDQISGNITVETADSAAKQTWQVPVVSEISKFAILGGIDTTKTEAANGASFAS